MKCQSYNLFLYFKQGDDFAHQIEKTRTIAGALRRLANMLKDAEATCDAIAKAIDGQKIEVAADTNIIEFRPLDKPAKAVLNKLVKRKLLQLIEEEI